MKLSQNGLEFLKQQEGVKLTAYQDSIGKWTIFVGLVQINGKAVVEGQTITMQAGDAELQKQLEGYELTVSVHVKPKLTTNQFDSLVSFCFNLGTNNFINSTLLKKINVNPNDATIAQEFLKWDKAGGKKIQGLTNRRIAESKLYFS